MIKKICDISRRTIISASAAVLILGFILVNCVSFGYETICRANGSLAEAVYKVDDFELIGIEKRGDIWFTTTDDSQMIHSGEMLVTSVKFYMDYTILPGEVVMYYTKRRDAPFSSKMRVWAKPVPGEEGWYIFNIRPTKIYSLRIDPTMFAGNELTLTEFRINETQSLASHFKVSYTNVYYFIVLTVILSAGFKLIQDLLIKISNKE